MLGNAQEYAFVNGIYMLAPDSVPGELVLRVYCDMESYGGGRAVIGHDHDGLTGDITAETPDQLAVALTYDIPLAQLSKLAQISGEKKQYFYKKCQGSLINKEYGTAHIRIESVAGTKVSLSDARFDDIFMPCDINDNVIRTSDYTLTNKDDILPIIKVWAGDSGAPSEHAFYKFGKIWLR